VIFAIIEFSMAAFQWSRMVEATRAGVRYAITNEPACDIFPSSDTGFSCDGGSVLACNAATPTLSVSRTISSCGVGDPACKIAAQMRRFSPFILAGGSQVKITYSCIDYETGDPQLANFVPEVTVEAIGVPYTFFMPGLLGIETTITMPSHAATRLGEDLYTYKP